MPPQTFDLSSLPDPWPTSNIDIIRPSGFRPAPLCPRRYLYANRLRWFPKAQAAAPALTIGHLLHRLMAGLYAGKSPRQNVVDLTDKLVPVFDAEKDETRRRKMTQAWNIARVTVDHWLAGFGHPLESEGSPKAETLAVELTIQQVLPSVYPPMTLIGTIDAAIRAMDTGEVWIVDHKSCSERPSLRAAGLSYDGQTRCYRQLWDSYAATKGLPPAVGMIHNIMQKPTIRLKKNQSYEDYWLEVGKWYEAGMADKDGEAPMIQSWVRFNEPPLTENPETLAEIAYAAEWAHKVPSLHNFPRCRQQCVDPFKRPCPYLPLCQKNPVLWADILATGFEKGPDPVTAALSLNESDDIADDFAPGV